MEQGATTNSDKQPTADQDRRSKPTAGPRKIDQSLTPTKTSRKQSTRSDQQIQRQHPDRTPIRKRHQPTLDKNHEPRETDKQKPVNQHPISAETIFLSSVIWPQEQSKRKNCLVNAPQQRASLYSKDSSPPQHHRQAQSRRPCASSNQNNAFLNKTRCSSNLNRYLASTVSTDNSKTSGSKYTSVRSQGQGHQNSLSHRSNGSNHSSNIIPSYRNSHHSLMQLSSRGSSMTSIQSVSSGSTSASPQSCLSSNAVHRSTQNSSMFLSSRGSPISWGRSSVPPQSCFIS